MTAATFSPAHPASVASEWFTADVFYRPRAGEDRISHGERLIDNRDSLHPIQTVADETNVIALKCFMILLAIPFYTLGVMATHIVRCFTLIGSNLAKGEISEAFLSLIQEVWAVAKTPIYGLAIAFYAFVGIFAPLPMRAIIAQLERDWSGSERRYSLCKLDGVGDYFTNRTSKTTMFLAFCFQPFGPLNNPDRVHSYQVKNLV